MNRTVNPSDLKCENFKRLATARTNRVIKQLQLLRNLSNTSCYAYEENDVEVIIRAIETELNDVKRSFDKKLKKNSSFDLSSASR